MGDRLHPFFYILCGITVLQLTLKRFFRTCLLVNKTENYKQIIGSVGNGMMFA